MKGQKMIRLIASDLDGTLLNRRKELPEELPQLIDALEAKGILFVPASGRSLASLYKKFGPVSRKLGFICQNGNQVVYRDHSVYLARIPVTELTMLLNECRRAGDLKVVLCGESHAFYSDRTKDFEDQVYQFFVNCVYVDDLFEALDAEPVMKIACVDRKGVQEHGIPALSHLAEKYALLDSGDDWLDISLPDENKEKGLEKLLEFLDIPKEDCMVFGDFPNDLSMIRAIPCSYAMINGHEDVKSAASHVTKYSNEENGVVRTISEVLNIRL